MLSRTLTRTLSLAVLTLAPLAGCDDKHPGSDPAGAEVEDAEEAPLPAVECEDVAPKECRTEGAEAGLSYCVDVDGEAVWSDCFAEGEQECLPGDRLDDICSGAYCVFADGEFAMHAWSAGDMCATPLVLSFDGGPIDFVAGDAAPTFAFDAATSGCATDWPTAPWLALDRDGDGQILGGHELFGSGTALASGRAATHGFEALAELDANGDGTVSAADPRFSELVLWSDHDGDRAGTPGEQVSIHGVGLVAIHLDFHRRGTCDERGNCGRERAAFEFRGPAGDLRVGEVVDVYLACQ